MGWGEWADVNCYPQSTDIDFHVDFKIDGCEWQEGMCQENAIARWAFGNRDISDATKAVLNRIQWRRHEYQNCETYEKSFQTLGMNNTRELYLVSASRNGHLMTGELLEPGLNTDVFENWRIFNFHELNLTPLLWNGDPFEGPQLQYGPPSFPGADEFNNIGIKKVTGIRIEECTLKYDTDSYANFRIGQYGHIQ
jgi:hypothetical protein